MSTPLTLQQVFNNAYRGFAKNGWQKCLNSQETSCVYDNGHGNHCAIGWSIPKGSLMMKYMGTVGELRAALPNEFKAVFGKIPFQALEDLQRAHDGAKRNSVNDNLCVRLKKFAQEYNLTIPRV